MQLSKQNLNSSVLIIHFALASTILSCLSIASKGADDASQSARIDVCVYGATPAGIAASVSAAKLGKKVILVEPTSRVGGLVTSGLSHTDFHSFESLTGSFRDFADRVRDYYSQTYGKDSPQVRDSFDGTFAEPKVNLLIFEKMIAEQPNIELVMGLSVQSAEVNRADDRAKMESAAFLSRQGNSKKIQAAIFIDASYEGDLAALAGVPFRVGREGRDEFDESIAPVKADNELQAYNFRFCMTQEPANRVMPVAPAGYRREDFVGVLDALASGKIKKIFDYPDNCIFKAQTPTLPNGKYDINDVSRSLVRLSLPGKNLAWPEGTAVQRQAVFDEHVRDQVGLLYFLQNDEAVPEHFRNEAREWGWCRDEFEETGHLPPQLYVREARRMVGMKVFSQKDSEHAVDGEWKDARAKLHRDSIAMGDYGNNCHGTNHEGPRFGGKHTGDFYNPVPPYQIPYGVIVPKDLSNLFVVGAVSSTHVGFCALRLEPIWMSLGQASGHAASQALDKKCQVQSVDIAALQHSLHRDRSATIYMSDVLQGHPDFEAVQWWGTLGGFHGLHPMPSKPGQRGEKIHGQYYQATPGHAAELDSTLDDNLRNRWASLVVTPMSSSIKTRGDWIREAYQRTIANDAK